MSLKFYSIDAFPNRIHEILLDELQVAQVGLLAIDDLIDCPYHNTFFWF